MEDGTPGFAPAPRVVPQPGMELEVEPELLLVELLFGVLPQPPNTANATPAPKMKNKRFGI